MISKILKIILKISFCEKPFESTFTNLVKYDVKTLLYNFFGFFDDDRKVIKILKLECASPNLVS